MGIHDGHRERLRQLYFDGGFESMSDVQKLELILTFSISRRDTNPIAHALLDLFGDFAGVLSAQPSDLMKVDGVSEVTAALLHIIPDAAQYRKVQIAEKQMKVLDTVEKVTAYLRPRYDVSTEERAYLLCMDAKCHPIRCHILANGELNTVNISVRHIVELAMQDRAVLAVLSHNHVSGKAQPSREDLQTTKLAGEALRNLNVTLADHIIIAGGDSYSFMEHGEL